MLYTQRRQELKGGLGNYPGFSAKGLLPPNENKIALDRNQLSKFNQIVAINSNVKTECNIKLPILHQ